MHNAKNKLIVANWKMNGLRSDAVNFLKELSNNININSSHVTKDIVICPPFTLIAEFSRNSLPKNFHIGAQNCSHEINGAYTGDISPQQLKDLGCSYVILGHSERRAQHHETDNLIKNKALSAHNQGLSVIICIGETLEENKNNLTKNILKNQILSSLPSSANSTNTIIAYEPIWAIGSGITPSNLEISQIHRYIYQVLSSEMPMFDENTRIIYGGSVNEINAESLLSTPNIDGLLVGKASLNIANFIKIINSITN